MKHTLKSVLLFGIAVSLLVGTGCKTKKTLTKSKTDVDAQMARDKAEQDRKKADEERSRKAAEEKAKGSQMQQEIEESFSQITTASSITDADRNIKAVLSIFSSADAPVLIIINKSGDIIDYDKPTTIKRYLEYLKDTKKNMNTVYEITKDDAGKIKELTLIKK